MKLVYLSALLIGNYIGSFAIADGMTIDRFFAAAFFGLSIMYLTGVGEKS